MARKSHAVSSKLSRQSKSDRKTTMTPQEAIAAGITSQYYAEEDFEENSVSNSDTESGGDSDDVIFIQEDELDKLKLTVQTEVKRLRKLNSQELLDAPYAIKLIKTGLKNVISPVERKKVKEIVILSHLKPSLKKPGLFQLMEKNPLDDLAKPEGLTESDRNLLQVFDQKLKNVRENVRNINVDLSGWQTSHSEQTRTMKSLSQRMEIIEEQNEDIDLDELQGKEQICVTDLVKVLREMKCEILQKTVTVQDLNFFKQHIREIAKENDQINARAKRDRDVINKIEDLTQLSGKFRDLQLAVLKNENLVNELKSTVFDDTDRLRKLELGTDTAERLAAHLEGKRHIDTRELSNYLINITREFQVSMVHKDEFMDLRAETGIMQHQMNELNVFKESIGQQSIDDHLNLIKNTHTIHENLL